MSLEMIKLLQRKSKNKRIKIGVRLNPNTDAKTLSQISTGKKENKFGDDLDEAYTGEGKLINSSFLNGMNIDQAKDEVIEKLIENNNGNRETNFRLRDWGISRQDRKSVV